MSVHRRTARNRSRPSVAVIGAGVAGTACARRLTEAGLEVQVFDKARGPGGRISTRRTNGFSFDHGAQYFTVRDGRFSTLISELRSRGIVERWDGVIVALDRGRIDGEKDTLERFVGVPGMNSLAKELVALCAVRYATRVQQLVQLETGWGLVAEDGEELGTWDAVVLSAPPPQSASLLETAGSPLSTTVQAVPMAPCWAVMAGWESRVRAGFDAAFVHGSPLSWVARNSSKPGRPQAESWVLHGSPEWSAAHVEAHAEDVAAQLLHELATLVRLDRHPVLLEAHRWRYALPEKPLASPCLVDRDRALTVCGDWCGGPRVEGAYLSGLAAAEEVLSLCDEHALHRQSAVR